MLDRHCRLCEYWERGRTKVSPQLFLQFRHWFSTGAMRVGVQVFAERKLWENVSNLMNLKTGKGISNPVIF